MNSPEPSGAAPSESRYERVKRILNTAQGPTEASYQGAHRFWELPLAEFLTFTLYGVRMIAPAPGESDAASSGKKSGSCCGGGGGGGETCSSSDAGSTARSSASGLIKGLKGEAPFDGTQFPRLPWGGSPVASADIDFIAQWIDAGCPADDKHHRSASVSASRLHALAQGHEAHPLSTKTLNEHREDVDGLKVRKNVNCLTDVELQRLRDAIAQMHTLDDHYLDDRSYDYWARIHASNCQHSWEQFLTWHRIYLYLFEQRLQDIDSTITLPYWDWTGDNQSWVPTTAPDTGEVPVAYACWINDAALDSLKGKIPDASLAQLAAIKGTRYQSAPRLFTAAGITYSKTPADNEPILAALEAVNPLWHRLRWPGGSPALFENYPRPEDIDRILKIDSFFKFGSGPSNDHFFGAVENIHNLMHLFSGGVNPNYNADLGGPQNRIEPYNGDMFANGTTTFDPLFWGHHSNVDRLWDLWQQQHPNVGPDDPSAVLPPFEFTVSDSYSVQKLGYEYQLHSSVFETEPTVSLTRFKSAKADVHPHALAKHKRADVRLHGVRYAVEGGGLVRVFLNAPDADAATPTKGNDHFVGQFALFSGACVGGPGHCAPPDGPRDRFDLRARHRKTPGNIRFDATETVKKLRAKGDTDFHVHVVVLGSDGKPKGDILRLDAVSLNFFD